MLAGPVLVCLFSSSSACVRLPLCLFLFSSHQLGASEEEDGRLAPERTYIVFPLMFAT